jgi:PleD family two-component response regulator
MLMPAHLHLAASTPGEGRSARPAAPIQVVVADDHAVVRRNLRRLLDGEEDVEVIAEAAATA